MKILICFFLSFLPFLSVCLVFDMVPRLKNYILVSTYSFNCSRGGKKIQFHETALTFKGLKCERISEVKSAFSLTFHRPLFSIAVVVCFGRYGRFVLVVSVVSFRSFRSFCLFQLLGFGRFVSLFRVLVHALSSSIQFNTIWICAFTCGFDIIVALEPISSKTERSENLFVISATRRSLIWVRNTGSNCWNVAAHSTYGVKVSRGDGG